MTMPLDSRSADPIRIALEALKLRVTALTQVDASLSAVHSPAVANGGPDADRQQQKAQAEARTRYMMRQIFGQIDDITEPPVEQGAADRAGRHFVR